MKNNFADRHSVPNEKSRLGIFVFYDPQGVVDEYVFLLLKELKKVVSRLIIVINGVVKPVYSEKLKTVSDEIFTRGNNGFDGGAYKDVLLNHIHKDELRSYDSLVLCNDTFYGPFYSFEKVFLTMQPFNFDFWGLSRNAGGGKVLGIGMEIPPHLQGFFLVVNKNLISNDCFLSFFKELDYPKTYKDAIEQFEIGFSTYFAERGFTYGDYAEVCGWKTLPNGNNYNAYADCLIRDYSFPILKKKALRMSNYLVAKNVLNYLKSNSNYDIRLILDNIERLRLSEKDIFNLEDIELFYKNHNKVYIWGNGKIGKNIQAFLESNTYIVSGVVTSETFSDNIINSNDGIILALGRKAYSEVLPFVKEHFSESQLLFPNFA